MECEVVAPPFLCGPAFNECIQACQPEPGACGDGVCGPGEGCGSCAEDCGACPPPPALSCGDILGCAGPCAAQEPACWQPCLDGADADAEAAFLDLVGCVEQSPCLLGDPACYDGLCPDLVQQCLAPPDGLCGDGVCGAGEDCDACAGDCGACPAPEPCPAQCDQQEQACVQGGVDPERCALERSRCILTCEGAPCEEFCLVDHQECVTSGQPVAVCDQAIRACFEGCAGGIGGGEPCDGLDNNGDGVIDEGCGEPCVADGDCATGQVCLGGLCR